MKPIEDDGWAVLTRMRLRMWIANNIPAGGTFSFDQFRAYCDERKYRPPNNPNAWGIIGKWMRQMRMVEDVGIGTASKRRSSHKRTLPIVRRLW